MCVYLRDYEEKIDRCDQSWYEYVDDLLLSEASIGGAEYVEDDLEIELEF